MSWTTMLALSPYIPHGHCYLWQTPLVGLHALADGLITIAYYSIPLTLLYFLRKQAYFPFPKLLILFSTFILLCGTTHLLDVVTLWFPWYWLSGIFKALTVLVSIYTAFELFTIFPQLLELKSPVELEKINQALNAEIQERQVSDLAIKELNNSLETKVRERTEEFAKINHQLAQEISERQKNQSELKNLSDRLELALNCAQIGIWDWDITNNCLIWDGRMHKIYGVGKGEFSGTHQAWQACIHPEDYDRVDGVVQQAMKDQKNYIVEFKIVPGGKGENIRFIREYGLVQQDENGNSARMIGVNLDVTERKLQEQRIHDQNRREILLREITQRIRLSLDLPAIFNTLVEEIRKFLKADRVAIYEFEPTSDYAAGVIVAESVVEPYTTILGSSVQETCFCTNYVEEYAKGRICVIDDIYNADLTPCYINFLERFKIKANLVLPLTSDSKLWGLLCIHQCSDARSWQSTEIDLLKQITSQFEIAIQQARLFKQSQQELQAKNELFSQLTKELEQKKILLKEIHHRVKNNLQIMSSLLYLQFSKAPAEIQALCEDCQNQIYSMALVHDQLYRSNDLTDIDFRQYLTDLINNLFLSYGIDQAKIQLIINIEEVYFSLDQAVPLGLIVHELVSNAIKHAFPHGTGAIIIGLFLSGHQAHLTVRDTGTGFSNQIDFDSQRGLGMRLVKNLAEQLEGFLNYEYDGGSAFNLVFPTQ